MSSHSSFALLLLALLAILLARAVVTDLLRRDIANGLTLLIAALAVPWWLANGLGAGAMAMQVGVAVGVFTLFAIFFFVGAMGGGDVKLIAAVSLWLPLAAVADLLVWTAIGGGVVTLAAALHHRRRRGDGAVEVPYGVAIAGAAMLVLANDILTTAAA